MMEYCLSKFDHFIVVINEPLTDYHRKVLTNLYAPILSSEATNLYTALFSLVRYGKSESDRNTHERLFSLLQINEGSKFKEMREVLEAFGLLDTYVYRSNEDGINLYMYIMKNVMDPIAFLNDDILSTILYEKLGETEFMKSAAEFLIHRYDIRNFVKITKSLDEVYQPTSSINTDYRSWWSVTDNNVKINHQSFDYGYYQVLMSSLDIVNAETLQSQKLYDTINRLSWIFRLSVENLKDATINALDENGNIDYTMLPLQCKKIYDDNNAPTTIKPKSQVIVSNNKLIQMLESLSCGELVESKYGTKLLGSEIVMFDKLQVATNFSNGMLNALIIYVMDNKKGEIPSYNYFLKIANTWIRSGIKNTEDALNYIQTIPSKKTKSSKPEKAVPEWYDKYKQELEYNQNKSTGDTSDESLKELDDFFNTKKGKKS